jgi:hypothetical protein
MTEPYLPAWASIDESLAWLQAKTGVPWTLARLLECGPRPWFWLDRSPDSPPEIFGDRPEGILAPMVFASDMQRLAFERTFALVTMSRTHDGKIFKVDPGLRVPLSELRFKKEDLEGTAECIAKKPDGERSHELPKRDDAVSTAPETSEAKNQRRYEACIDAGFKMPTSVYARLPDGIGRLAAAEGISVPAFTKSVKKHIEALGSRR